jgi:hypothetical protein
LRGTLLGLCLLPLMATAQVYKCVGHDGSTSYSSSPCPAAAGETTIIIQPMQPSAPALPHGMPRTESAPAPATRPGGSRVTVIEDSDAADRAARAEDMREEALQHKRDLYAPKPEQVQQRGPQGNASGQ